MLELNLELREEVEVMFTKLVLKPLEQITQKMVKEQPPQKKSQGKDSADSDEDVSKRPALQEVVGAGELTGSPLGQTESRIFVDCHINFALETLMSLKPE